MTPLDLTREGPVFILTMQVGENRFNRAFLDALHGALDTVEQSSGPAALVTTGARGKFYSNGLDLQWLAGEGRDEGPAFVDAMLAAFGRLLALAVPTVAAINGHAFAAGGMFALAHDQRVMRADRGFFCLPEVDINLPFTPGMTALIKCKLTPSALRYAVLTGARIGGQEAAARAIVDEAVAAEEVLPRAVALAAGVAGKDRVTYAALKRDLYGDVLATLECPRGL
jgi:enoyl-CoA hydratase/carnithine racemase